MCRLPYIFPLGQLGGGRTRERVYLNNLYSQLLLFQFLDIPVSRLKNISLKFLSDLKKIFVPLLVLFIEVLFYRRASTNCSMIKSFGGVIRSF